ATSTPLVIAPNFPPKIIHIHRVYIVFGVDDRPCRLDHFAGRDKFGLPPLGLGAGGGELLSDRPFLSFLLPHIAGKVPPSDLSVLVKHRATGEGVGRTTSPRLLSPIPRVAKRAPLRHVRHRRHRLPPRHRP